METAASEAHEITQREARDQLDAQARRYLGISGEAFVKAWREGRYTGPESDRPEVIRVAMLLPGV